MRPPVALALVVSVPLLIYARTLAFDFTYLDDDQLIVEQAAVLAEPGSAARAFERPYFPASARDHTYYRPLANASYALDTLAEPVEPWPFHATNLLLHALSSGLLLLVLRKFGWADPPARFTALWFAVHPALTSAVAWIPGRPDLLLGVFSLASLWLWQHARANASRLSAAGHGLLWLLALLTKESALVLPLVCAAYPWLVEKQSWRKLVPWPILVGWLAALSVYVAARVAVVSDDLGLEGVSLASFLTNLPLLVTSLGKLVVPVELSVLATRADTSLGPGLAALGLVALAARFSGARPRRLAFGLVAFALPILPGLPASGALALESRLYLPAVGVAFVVAEVGSALRVFGGRAVGVGVALLAVFGVVAFDYADSFRGRRAFSEAAVQGSPHSALAHRNLGLTYQLEGDRAAATSEYRSALVEDDEEPVVRNNLAVIHMAEARLDEAEKELRRELEYNPGYVPAERNLALVLDATKRAEEAVPHWERVVKREPRDAQALRALVSYYGPRDSAKADRYRAFQ